MNFEYKNNWEADEYFIDGTKVTDITEIEIGGERYDVIAREVSVPYNDMGHIYEGRSKHFFIQVPIGRARTHLVTVDLNTLMRIRKALEITPIRYRLATDK